MPLFPSLVVCAVWQDENMAKRTMTVTVDDIDGSALEPGTAEKVQFGIDGRHLEIDLTAENAATLRDILRPFTEGGRRVARVKFTRRA